jgi:CheY-like chemotaxis protein
MSRPVLMAVDDDPAALGVLAQELRKRYGDDYQVLCDGDPQAALRTLERVQADGGQVALVLADQWMPAMTGVQLLARAHRLHPTAQRALLIDWRADPSGGDLRPGRRLDRQADPARRRALPPGGERVPVRVGAAAPPAVPGAPGRR